MNKKLIAVTVLVCFAAALMFVLSKSTEKKLNVEISAGKSGQTTVLMGEDEYTPSIFTVKKGTKVIFTNTAPAARWPASNLHPSHEIYPEFDPKEPVLPGRSWEFEFKKTGTWEMHDHLAPYITGTVTVVD
jgi:hypothetical protein